VAPENLGLAGSRLWWRRLGTRHSGSSTRQATRRGTFCSVKDFTAAIGACHDRCQPLTWTEDADDLMTLKD
jgi:hypothetical protein